MDAPGNQFMKRFSGYRPRVKKFTRSTYIKERMEQGGAMLLAVTSIRWRSKTKVVASGYIDSGPGEGVYWIYELKRKGNKWTVGDVMNYG